MTGCRVCCYVRPLYDGLPGLLSVGKADSSCRILNQQCPSGMPPHLMKLGVGVLRNFDSKNGC